MKRPSRLDQIACWEWDAPSGRIWEVRFFLCLDGTILRNPQTPLVLPGNMGEAIGAWIDDSENEIFTVNYANNVFFCCRVSLKPANMPFCHRGNARGMQFHVSLLQCFETCFSLETGREQWHPTDWIYRYLSSNCSMETEPGPQTGCVLDVFWAIFWVGWRKNHTLIGFKIGP